MKIKECDVLRLLSKLPVVGPHYKVKLDRSLRLSLLLIEGRFSNASTRFVTQMHDLYDCLKLLETPLNIKVNKFHGFALTMYTKSSQDAYTLLENIAADLPVSQEPYFNTSEQSHSSMFLDWFSNEHSLNEFIEHMRLLLHMYCESTPSHTKPEGGVFKPTSFNCNEQTQAFVKGNQFKLLILDLIRVLNIVLTERIGD